MTINGVNTTGYLPPSGATDTAGAQGAQSAHGTADAGQSEFDPSSYVGTATPGLLGNRNRLPDPPPGDKRMDQYTIDHLGSLDQDQVSTDIFSFMALFQKMAQGMRDTARTQRAASAQAQVSALQGAAEKMKDAAEERYKAGIAQGITQVIGGAMQVGFSAASAAQTIKGASLENQGQDKLAETRTSGLGRTERMDMMKEGNALIAQGKEAAASGGARQSYGSALSSISGGIGGCVAAHYTREADKADAERANLDAQAKVAETAQQQANDAMQQMMDIVRDVRDKLQSIQQAAVETNRGIARNI